MKTKAVKLTRRNTPEYALEQIPALVDQQAEDEGLWATTVGRLHTFHESYLMQELRKLHALVESLTGPTDG